MKIAASLRSLALGAQPRRFLVDVAASAGAPLVEGQRAA